MRSRWDEEARWEGASEARYRQYLAIERPRQGASSSHPKGMTLQALRVVDALDRGHWARSSRVS
ncbi:MAG TPA: hypothetical protein VEB39_09550 [Sphingomicrobium sp.]|nr:hypothetical protein [Sphingomicrobium sp.]